MMAGESPKIVYVFIDESGNYDFSCKGTDFMVFAALSSLNPVAGVIEAEQLRHRINAEPEEFNCKGIERFHATEDKQAVRNAFFEILADHFDFVADVVFCNKEDVPASEQSERGLMTMMLPSLVKLITCNPAYKDAAKFIIYTDRLPVRRKRKALEGALKKELRSELGHEIDFLIYHVDSKCQFYLQAADYVCWAVFRKLESNDQRSYKRICKKIRSINDHFGSRSPEKTDPPG